MSPNYKKTLALPILLALIAIVFFVVAPKQGAAQGYVPLAPIEGTLIPGTNKTDLSTYLTGIFKVGVAGAGALAFLMIVWGGFTYLSTDVITGKEEGKARIERAVGGLILALTSYIILNTINPKLVELDLYFGAPADIKNALAAPAEDMNHALTDQQLGMLKTASVERDNEMKTQVTDKKEEARKLKETADALPAGPEKNALLKKVADLNREAGEIDLQRVAAGEERQASANTLNAYTPEKLAVAITEAGSSVQKIQEAYAKARTEFASDPARVAALSTEEMNKIAVIRKSTAFGILENPPKESLQDLETGMTTSYVSQTALNTKIGEQMSLIKTEERNQVAKLTNLNGQNLGLKTSDISAQIAGIHDTAKQQICQIKNLCKEKGYSCHTLYPGTACVY